MVDEARALACATWLHLVATIQLHVCSGQGPRQPQCGAVGAPLNLSAAVCPLFGFSHPVLLNVPHGFREILYI